MDDARVVFTALSDPIRLRSLLLMAEAGELCVCELTHALQIHQPKMSKHLATLREAGLVRDRRDAQWVFYAISPDLPPWVQAILAATAEGLANDPVHSADSQRLQEMAGRPAPSRTVRPRQKDYCHV